MKWFLVWYIISPGAQGTYDWKVVQEAKDDFPTCIEELAIKNATFEEIKFEDPTFSYVIFCSEK